MDTLNEFKQGLFFIETLGKVSINYASISVCQNQWVRILSLIHCSTLFLSVNCERDKKSFQEQLQVKEAGIEAKSEKHYMKNIIHFHGI